MATMFSTLWRFKYCAHVGRVHVRVDHFEPEQVFSRALVCDHKCLVSMCLIRSTPDLFVVPLSDDESELISALPANVRCSNCIPPSQLRILCSKRRILTHPTTTQPLLDELTKSTSSPRTSGSTTCSCALYHQRLFFFDDQRC